MTERYRDESRTLSAEAVLETLHYVEEFCGDRILIKIGGKALESMEIVKRLCRDLALIRAAGISLIIVHGGGAAINAELELHGIEWEFVHGQRRTTDDMMDIIETTLCGRNNRNLVRTLNASGVKAIGLSGTDGGFLRCEQKDAGLGRVGQIVEVDREILEHYVEGQRRSGEGFIPVVAPIGIDRSGNAYNINADTAAAALAKAFGVRKLIYLTDQDGILDSDGNLIARLDTDDLDREIETGLLAGGMRAKAETIIDALESKSVEAVHILNGTVAHSLIQELFTDEGSGTLCRLST